MATAEKKTTTKETAKSVPAAEKEVKEVKTAAEAPEKAESAAKAEPAEKKEPAAKKTTRKTTAKKTTTKKTAAAEKTTAKKTTTKKTAEKKPVNIKNTKVFLQYGGKEVDQEELVQRIVEKWCADEGKRASSIKELNIYIKPEDNAAYYVINGQGSSVEL